MKPKVAFVGNLNTLPYSPDHAGVKQGLEKLGLEYLVLDPHNINATGANIAELALAFKPDLIVHGMTDSLSNQWPEKIKVVLPQTIQVMSMWDYRPVKLNYDGLWDTWKKSGPYLDLVTLSNKGQLEWWRNDFGVETMFWPHGCVVKDVEYDEKYNVDNVFVGDRHMSPPYNERVWLIDEIQKYLKPLSTDWINKGGGDADPHRAEIWKDLGRIYYSAKTVLDISHFWDCYDDQTEVLTENGWKFFKELSGMEKLATVNLETDFLEFQKPEALIKGTNKEVITVNGKRLNFSVTPNHRMVIYNKNSTKPEIINAKDLKPHHSIKLTVKNLHSESSGIIYIPASFKKYGSIISKQEIEPKREVNAKDFASLLGWYVAEGNRWSGVNLLQGNRRYKVIISQKNEEKTRAIKELLNKLPWRYTYLKGRGFEITSKQLYEAVADCGDGAINKRVPYLIKRLSQEEISAFIDSAILGDGYENGEYRSYYTISKQLADDMQELFLRVGKSASIKIKEQNDGCIGRRIIRGKHPIYRVNELVSDRAGLRQSDGTFIVEKEDYWFTKNVYCATVSNGTLVVRRNGMMMVCGNSPGYASGRYFYTSGLGGCAISKRFPDCEELFPEGTKIYFDIPEEAAEKIKFYVANEKERNKIRAKGKDWANKYHNYEVRFSQLFKHLGL